MKRFFVVIFLCVLNCAAMDKKIQPDLIDEFGVILYRDILDCATPERYEKICRYLDRRLHKFLMRRQKFLSLECNVEDFILKVKEREKQNKKDRLDGLRYNQLINDKHTKMYKVDRNAKNGKIRGSQRQGNKTRFLGNR